MDSKQQLPNQPNKPQHRQVFFKQPNQPSIFFSSTFDSANMKQVVRNDFQHYSIWTASDCQGTEQPAYSKSWFYFQVGGFINRPITFSIHRLHFLWSISKKPHLYRPVYRISRIGSNINKYDQITTWQRLPHPIISLTMNTDNELVLKFDFFFDQTIKWVQFAFIYPYSYTECRQDVAFLKQQFQLKNDSEICLRTYEFCRSYQGRVLDLIVISSHQGKQGYQGLKLDDVMTFSGEKLIKYRDNKPIIFISARVHPIETPSSYCMNGIIAFLTDKKDMRAYLLRKYFVFVLVPMLNPDGVANGHCRMDTLNQNLNRYYKNPDPIKQPSCYSVKKLCEHYNKQKRIFMYLDLHAHPGTKGNFLFGNAIFDYIQQVQSQIFPKILAQNCISFQFQQCNFSRKHMKAKDRFQDMNKEGSGRVVFYRQFGVGHSYTLQCGYHCNSYDNVISPPTNTQAQFIIKYKLNENGEKIYDGNQKCVTKDKFIKQDTQNPNSQSVNLTNRDKYSFIEDPLDNINSEYYGRQIVFFTPQTFHNLGKNIMVSILDIWNKNPYSRINDINQQRKHIAQKQSKLDRFRKEQAGIKTKQKRIIELIEQQFYGNWHRRNVMVTQQLDIRKTQFNVGRARRTQKIITVESKNQTSKQITIIDKPTISTNKQITNMEECVSKNGVLNNQRISIMSGSSQAIMKIGDCKNIFRPINLRIRNMIIPTNNK